MTDRATKTAPINRGQLPLFGPEAVRQAAKPPPDLRPGELRPDGTVWCSSPARARQWLDENGWAPRHSGGYARGARGRATVTADPEIPGAPCIIKMEGNP